MEWVREAMVAKAAAVRDLVEQRAPAINER
jgi:hypothetical protein